MSTCKQLLSTLWLWLLLLPLTLPLWAAEVPQDDVRILIDVSGSMKKTDPNNLRIPALRLLTNLLPSGSEAGVWTFGKHTNMLVGHAQVSPRWREQAQALAAEIHSRAQFTNIGDALDKSTRDWQGPPGQKRRSLILLTDGVVDISPEPGANEQERSRILHSLLPKLKAAGVKIHTVALSDGVDEELMQQLSGATDGWFLKVLTADELQAAFLKLFDQVARRDELPMQDNRFKVDPDVKEFTLLVFRQPETPPAILIEPGGRQYQAQDKSEPQVQWFSEKTYDLITLSNPKAGEWSVQAAIDPNNRVMVVSNLALVTSELPSNLFLGESLTLTASLTEEGKVITERTFLMNTQLVLTQLQEGLQPYRQLALDDGVAPDQRFGDGIFTASLPKTEKVGEMTLRTDLKAPTFQRQRQQSLMVLPSPLQTQAQWDGDRLRLGFTPVAHVKPDGLKIQVLAKGKQTQAWPVHATQDGWALVLEPTALAGNPTLSALVSGSTQSGRVFELETALSLPGKAPPAQETEMPPPVEPIPAPALPPEVAEEETAAPAEESSGEWPWWLWALIGLGANVLLFGTGIWGMRLVRKANEKSIRELESVLEDKD